MEGPPVSDVFPCRFGPFPAHVLLSRLRLLHCLSRSPIAPSLHASHRSPARPSARQLDKRFSGSRVVRFLVISSPHCQTQTQACTLSSQPRLLNRPIDACLCAGSGVYTEPQHGRELTGRPRQGFTPQTDGERQGQNYIRIYCLSAQVSKGFLIADAVIRRVAAS